MGIFMDMLDVSRINITQEILSIIAEIDEFKGAWKALGLLAPDKLTALKKVATIESIGSSTRIEGSKLTDKEVEQLLSNLQIKEFSTRDEQEVGGYSAVMNMIFQDYEYISLTENHIKQLHRDLLQFSDKDAWHRGEYKKSPNHVEAFDAQGKSIGMVFETTPPFETPIKMRELVEWTRTALETKQMHPLLIVGIFIVVFLAIHPFQDGNGRLSRILTTLLLMRAGYNYTSYASLEAVIEKNKEGYYLSLRQTQGTIKTDNPNFQPWILYFLQALQQQKNNLEKKIERENLLLKTMPELSLKIIEIVKERGRITNNEIVQLTQANRNTVKKRLENLVNENLLQKHGVGKGTWYSLS